MSEITLGDEILTDNEQFVLMIVKAFEDIGCSPSFQESWQGVYKQAADVLTSRGLLRRTYDSEVSPRPKSVREMDYSLKSKKAVWLAEILLDSRGWNPAEMLTEARRRTKL